MKVYKVKLIKNEKTYYINQAQKDAIETAIAEKRKGLMSVGNDQIRLGSIDYIQQVDMDENDLPSYFVKDSSNVEQLWYKKLPTSFVILDVNGKMIPGVVRSMIEKAGKPYMIALAHYTGESEERRYYLKSGQIKRLTLMTPQPDSYPHSVAQVWEYGVAKL